MILTRNVKLFAFLLMVFTTDAIPIPNNMSGEETVKGI